MDEELDINLLITRYLNGNASLSEKKQVESWVKESPLNQYQFNKLKEYWEKDTVDPKLINHEFQKQNLWNQYLDTSKPNTVPLPNTRRKGRLAWISIAASITLLLTVTALFSIRERLFAPQEIEVSIASVEKYNPNGQKSQTQLPDGSKVWLNSDSKITYPEKFSDSLRIVQLEGEAFFDVQHDSDRPFIVVADKIQVRVLGTKFNVNAFTTQKEITIALVEGSINVTSDSTAEGVLVKPSHGVSYSKQLDVFREFSKQGNPEMFEKAISWKSGKLVFDGDDLEDFVTEISRWYGVTVRITGVPQNDWRLVGAFENEFLTNVLDAIAYNKGFTYELNEKELTLIFN